MLTFSQKKTTKKGRNKCLTLSCFSCHDETSKLTHADPDKSIWNFYLSSGQIIKQDKSIWNFYLSSGQIIWSDARIQVGRAMHISRCVMTR